MLDNKTFNCSMELTLDIIGGKWKPILIYHIGNHKNIRYGELKRIIPTISERVLSRELRSLEASKIIQRTVYNEKILRVEYCLTEIGNEILPVLHSLNQWGQRYNEIFSYAKITIE